MIGRTKPNFQAAGGNAALDLAYNDKSGALKTLGITKGHLIIMGALNSGKEVALGSMIHIFNSDTAIHYVATGAAGGVTAPTSPANGIPVPPGQYITISMGQDQEIISDSATVYGYLVDDETSYSLQTQP
jgi:hypothetical protein